MECVRAHFAPDTEPLRARAAFLRAVRSVNRLDIWRTLCADFFAFAEVPASETEFLESSTEEQIPESVAEKSEPEDAPESLTDADAQSLTVAESPFFCILLCPDMRREALAAVSEASAREGVAVRFAPMAPEEAEDCYREALDLCRGQEAAAPEFAAACQHLAFFLSDTDGKAEAEALYREALDCRRKLSGDRAGRDEDIAEICYYLARLLYGMGRADEAEKRYCEAMDIYRELSKRNGAFQSPLARTCQDLAICLEDSGRPGAAEWFYRSALDGYRKLAERNPAAYAPRVAAACGNLAGLLKSSGRVREAAALYRVALETYVRLVQENPAKWEPELAFLYENLAAFEFARSPSAGKALLQSAWTLYQKYPNLSAEAERVQAQMRELGTAEK